jgi:hypothetical protein
MLAGRVPHQEEHSKVTIFLYKEEGSRGGRENELDEKQSTMLRTRPSLHPRQ